MSAHDHLLLLAADLLDDLEKTRIANTNRLGALEREGLADTPEFHALADVAAGILALEKTATLNLQRIVRKHPLGWWIRQTVGVGEKQGGRLLAAIGDPYIRAETVDRETGEVLAPEEPRTVSQLWAYCGYHVIRTGHGIHDSQSGFAGAEQNLAPGPDLPGTHITGAGGEQNTHLGHEGLGSHPPPAEVDGSDPGQAAGVAAKRRKGQRANWSNTAKMRARLIAESCIKQRHSPYRDVYDQRRKHTTITHPEWTDGHSHNDALRIVAKRVLKDLWLVARDMHNAIETAA